MKVTFMRSLALLLVGVILFSCIACANNTGNVTETTNADTQETIQETETSFKPDIDTKNYESEFIITGVGSIRDYATVLEEERGDPLMDTIYERNLKVEEQLGVEIIDVDAGDWLSYTSNILRTVQSGDDEYQLVSTHPYQGVIAFLTSDAAYDFAQLESVNLDAPYWASDFMSEMIIHDKYLVGYNDMCLTSVHCIMFNKEMMETYRMQYPYDEVINKTWTLDKFFGMASTMTSGSDNSNGVYGIAGSGWIELISFVTSSNVKVVDKDSEGIFRVAYENNSEKTYNLLEKVSEMFNSEYAYLSSPRLSREGVDFRDGTSMFYLQSTGDLPNYRDTAFEFGVLPYPLYDESQENYRALNWNGVMIIPASIKNTEMVSDVVELLAYYSASVKTAYYEDLLGSKIAQAPQDAQMLDIIWGSVVSDIGMITANLNGMDPLLYMVPNLCVDGIDRYASFLKSNSRSANRSLDQLFDQE